MGRYRIAVAVGAAAVLATGSPAAAGETSAGRGGRILTLAVTQGHGYGELRSMRPDGTAVVAYGRQLAWYSSPDYAPGGDRIAYAADDFTVWLMDADGANDRPLAGGPCGPSSPRWSPDGRWVAFESCSDIYVVSADGPAAGFRNATASDLNDLQAAWNPRGTRIATATLPGVHVYRAGGSPARAISHLPGAVRLDWNPNGRTFVVAAQQDLWLVDARTGAEVRLTDTPDLVESDPVWSPDGRWLAFGRGPVDPDDPDEQPAARDPQIWLMTATGSRARTTGVPGIPTSWRAQP